MVGEPHAVHYVRLVSGRSVMLERGPGSNACPGKDILLFRYVTNDRANGILAIWLDHKFRIASTGCGWDKIPFFVRPIFNIRVIRAGFAWKWFRITNVSEDFSSGDFSWFFMEKDDQIAAV